MDGAKIRVLFRQPLDRVVGQPLLKKVENLNDCAEAISEPDVKICVDDRLNLLADELLKFSDGIEIISDTPVRSKDGVIKHPRKICRNNFDVLIEAAKVKAEKGHYRKMVEYLRQAVLFARWGGVDKETIRQKILEVVGIMPLKPAEKEPEEPQAPIPEGISWPESGDEVPVPKEDQGPREEAKKEFFQKAEEYRILLSGGPLLSYEGSPNRTYLSLGGTAEILMPFRAQSHFVFGAEFQLLARLGFDNHNIFDGELKSIEGISLLPLLEVGYHDDTATVLFQAGFWFTFSRLFGAKEDSDPYSDNMFENKHLRLGIKAYLNKRFRLSGGYQKTPWGPAGYFEIGYLFWW